MAIKYVVNKVRFTRRGTRASWEAEGITAVAVATISTFNSVDDIGQNKNGESIIEQSVNNPLGKRAIHSLKNCLSAVQGIKGISSLNKTIESPFQSGSTISDMKSNYDDFIRFKK